MAPFSIPAPSIIPLRLPVFGGSKSIDTNTKVQLLCETYLDHDIFYTLDGTKPQPYGGIVQGSKTLKYSTPFYLPAGKITIRALAINTCVHTMCSSVITKCFDVIKVECNEDTKLSPKAKQPSHTKSKKKLENKINLDEKTQIEEKISDVTDCSIALDSVKEVTDVNCLEQAFICCSDFDIENADHLENSIESESPVEKDVPDGIENLEESDEDLLQDVEDESFEKDSLDKTLEKLVVDDKKNMDKANAELTDSGTSIDTKFCCLKCDLTLQQCDSCNKMNAVSSKFCIECGKQLILICAFCKENNTCAAIFCQFCGKKLGTRLDPYIRLNQVDQSVMAKPQLKNTGIQKLPVMVDKCIQTANDKSPVKKGSDLKRMPRRSPGRGYWHQQLDYICNNLKSHAYNNIEFRKEISEPSLCDFQSAHISKDEENIVVTLTFTPLLADRNNNTSLEETKNEDKKQRSS